MQHKIVLIGSGAREHAMGDALVRSSTGFRIDAPELFVWASSRNPGLMQIAQELRVGNMDDVSGIVSWASELGVAFVVVGPELPLSVGVVNALSEVGIPSVGPTLAAAELETSKSFTRDLLVGAGIDVCPAFKKCLSEEDIDKWMREYQGEIVVKPDGLTGGKGVRVQGDHFDSRESGFQYAKECLEQDGLVLLEEKLVGQEFSLMSFCDGVYLRHMPAVQDNKRLLPGDAGPNTGGMGSVSDKNHSLPFLGIHDVFEAQRVNEQVARALRDTGREYKGILYGNFIATRDGVKIIEYNARLGDPEAMNVMTLLESDFVDICRGIIDGNLHEKEVRFARQATVCKYLVPDGYPENSLKDVRIEVPDIREDNVRVFYAAVDQRGDGLYLTGSRAVGVVGIGDTIGEAEVLAEEVAVRIEGPVQHRADIGSSELLDKRRAMMYSIRNR